MAAQATIYKATISIANMDTHYYQEHTLTLAQHPSENDLRLMMRLIAFVFNPHERLTFGEGIAKEDEPDLWHKELNDDMVLWILLGQADEKRIRKACGKAKNVIIYIYQEGAGDAWWRQNKKSLERFKNLSVIFIRVVGSLEALVQRNMRLQCNINDNELSIMDDSNSVDITQEIWKT